MRKAFTLAVGLLLGSPVLAQTSDKQAQSNTSAPPRAQGEQTTESLSEQIRSNLEQAGFKNIKLMPGSFIVRAEDQNSNPVMMVINPDSITTVSQTSNEAPNSSDRGTVGQGSSPSPSPQAPNPNGASQRDRSR